MSAGESAVELRVRYAETDQMGVAHHRNYLVWCELGRTHHMEQLGVRYRDLEQRGIRLPVIEANLRFRAPARYDDSVRVRSWIRDRGNRSVEFGSAIENAETNRLLATARITLIAINALHIPITLPLEIRERLVPTDDPVRV